MKLRVTVFIFMASLVASPCAPAGTVHLRGGQPSLSGAIITVNDAGVTLRAGTDDVRVVPWDVIADLKPDQPDPGLAQRLEVAEQLWRARRRVERHDTALAESLFERLFERYRGQTHETALIVAEGLLRCRLARGANQDATIAWLEVSRLRRGDVHTERYADLPDIYDEETALCPALAPAWADVDGLDRLAADLGRFDAGDDEVLAAIAKAYRALVLAHASGSVQEVATVLTDPPRHPGVDLLRRMLDAWSTDAALRESARQRLLREITSRPPWVEPWIRYHIGVSWLAERTEERRRSGLVHLSHLPARFAGLNPYLAGLALARAADGLAAGGNESGAASMRAELMRRFPGHPVLLAGHPDPTAPDDTKENT